MARSDLNSIRSRSIRTERCRWQWGRQKVAPNIFSFTGEAKIVNKIRYTIRDETFNFSDFRDTIHQTMWQIYHRVHDSAGSARPCADPLATLAFSHPDCTESRRRLSSPSGPTDRDLELVRNICILLYALFRYIESAKWYAPALPTAGLSSNSMRTVFQGLHLNVKHPTRLQSPPDCARC